MNTRDAEHEAAASQPVREEAAAPAVSAEASVIERVIAAYTATARDGRDARKQAFDNAVSAYLSLRPAVSKEEAGRAVANIICRQV